MATRKSTVTTEENYLNTCKNAEMINLYKKLRSVVFESFDNVETAATAQYISWRISGGRQFVNFYIQKHKIRVLTVEPSGKYNLGETVPDTHLWSLNYQTDILSEDNIDEVKRIICESYNKLSY